MKKVLSLFVGLFALFVWAVFAMDNVSWSASTLEENVEATYTFEFTTTADVTDPFIYIHFPIWFNVSPWFIFYGYNDPSSIDISIDSWTWFYPYDWTYYLDPLRFVFALYPYPTPILSGSTVTISISDIINPSAGSYSWSDLLYYGEHNMYNPQDYSAQLSDIEITVPAPFSPFDRCNTNSGSINIPYQECLGLAYLYTETDGSDRYINTNWFSNTDVTTWRTDYCEYYFVNEDYYLGDWNDFCDGVPFNGSWPAYAVALTWVWPIYNVYGINLYNNGLEWSIQSWLIYFPELTYLLLDGNDLSSVNLSQNTKLELLLLWDNDDTNPWTIDLSNNTLLTYLTLDDLNLDSLTLDNHPNLYYLDIDGNDLTSFDNSYLSGLIYLDAEDNLLTTFDMSYNPNLQYLRIEDNNLSTLTWYVGHQHIRNLDFSYNMVSGAMYFVSMPALEYVDAEENLLESVSFFDLPMLYDIDFSDNNLSWSLELSWLQNLYYVYFDENQLTSLSLYNLPALYNADFDDNHLSSFTYDTIPQLYYLDLSYNLFTSFSLSGISTLYSIQLDNNNLTSIALEWLPALYELYLSDNNLTSIHLDSINLPSLYYLYIGDNLLTSAYLDLPSLAYLYMYDNSFSSTNFLATGDLTNLEYLELSDNLITHASIINFPYLSYIYLSNNPLASLTLEDLPDLNTLYLNNASPTVLDETNIPWDIYLYLENNALTSLPSWVADLNVIYLYLRDNRFSTWPTNFQSQYPYVMYVDLSRNCLADGFDSTGLDWLPHWYNTNNQLYCVTVPLENTLQGTATLTKPIGRLGWSNWWATNSDLSIIRNGFLGDYIGIAGWISEEIYDEQEDDWYDVFSGIDASFVYTWTSAVMVSSVSVWWEEGWEWAYPGDYSFSYWNGTDWTTPSTWIATANDDNQEFRTEHNFTLSAPVSTTQVRLYKPSAGEESGIWLSQFLVYAEIEDDDYNPPSGGCGSCWRYDSSRISITSTLPQTIASRLLWTTWNNQSMVQIQQHIATLIELNAVIQEKESVSDAMKQLFIDVIRELIQRFAAMKKNAYIQVDDSSIQ